MYKIAKNDMVLVGEYPTFMDAFGQMSINICKEVVGLKHSRSIYDAANKTFYVVRGDELQTWGVVAC